MEDVINTSLKASRFSFSKFNLPESYRNLVQLEVNEDYTMGYVNHVGFRAGSCTPFLFYDLDYEVQTPLKVCPFHVMDFALLQQASLLDKKQILKTIILKIYTGLEKNIHLKVLFTMLASKRIKSIFLRKSMHLKASFRLCACMSVFFRMDSFNIALLI